MELRKIRDVADGVIYGHDPVPGATGFRLSHSLTNRRPHTWDGTRTEHKFPKGTAWVKVEALMVGDIGIYPPPPSQFGSSLLPARMPLNPTSSPPPSGGMTNQHGTAARPITIRGGQVSTLPLTACSYIRLQGVEIAGGWDGVKLDGCSHIELDGLDIHDTQNQGVLQVGGGTNIQAWNTKIANVGIGATHNPPNQRHGVYISDADGFVIANCDISNPSGYAVQLYPDPRNGIVTCSTLRGGVARGGIIVDGQNIMLVGLVVEAAPDYAFLAYSQVQAFDSLYWRCGSGPYGATYTRVANLDPSSRARGYIDPARYGYVPATDIDGRTRQTADAGAYALSG